MDALILDLDLIRDIYEYQPEAATWVLPVWDQNEISGERKIIDFGLQYCNPASEKVAGKPRGQMIGKCILEHKLPEPGKSQLTFDQCLQVYNSGTRYLRAHFQFSD